MLISNKKSVIYLLSLCKQLEIKDIVICPGSRNLPLILSFSSDPFFQCHSCIDERVAGFVALGITKSTQKPAIVITTSGSAAINLGPAMAEAYYQHAPLIAITADRPIELINKGENQTIIQKGLFTNYLNLELEIPEKISFDKFEKLVQPLFFILQSKDTWGNIHINLPFSEPLAETENILGEYKLNYTVPYSKKKNYNLDLIDFKSKNTVIYLSTNGVGDKLKLALDFGIENLNWIVICDINTNYYHERAIYNIELILSLNKSIQPIDILITIGEQMMSKKWRNFCKLQKNLKHIDISEYDRNWNSLSTDYQLICANLTKVLNELKSYGLSNNSDYAQSWKFIQENAVEIHENFFSKQRFSEFWTIDYLMSNLENSTIYWGNSSVVRYANWSNHAVFNSLKHITNRGVSGIDGVLATAIGYQLKSTIEDFYCILGDISLLYETNSLQIMSQIEHLKIIVFNNHGGKIFDNIHNPESISNLKPLNTPQTYDLSILSKLFDIQYVKSIYLDSFLVDFSKIKQAKGKLIWELDFPEGSNLDWRRYFELK